MAGINSLQKLFDGIYIHSTENLYDSAARGVFSVSETRKRPVILKAAEIAERLKGEGLIGRNNYNAAQIERMIEYVEEDILPLVSAMMDFDQETTRDQREAEWNTRLEIMQCLTLLNRLLQFAPFIAGEKLSLADICAFCALLDPRKASLEPFDGVLAALKPYDEVLKWYEKVSRLFEVKRGSGIPRGEAPDPPEGQGRANHQDKSQKSERKDQGESRTKQDEQKKSPTKDFNNNDESRMHFLRHFDSQKREDVAVVRFWSKKIEKYQILRCEYNYPGKLAAGGPACSIIKELMGASFDSPLERSP